MDRARTAHGRLSAVPAANDGSQSNPAAAKKRDGSRRTTSRSASDSTRQCAAGGDGHRAAAPFKQVTSSLQSKVTVVALGGGCRWRTASRRSCSFGASPTGRRAVVRIVQQRGQ